MPAPRIRLTLLPGDAGGCDRLDSERVIRVEELGDQGERGIGWLYVPGTAVPQLGALGVLVGLGVFSALELVGEGAPEVLKLEPRMIRLMKIAAKVLG